MVDAAAADAGLGRIWVVGDVARGEETDDQDIELVAEGADGADAPAGRTGWPWPT